MTLTTRIALAVDDRRVDVCLPSTRPIGEYLLRVVALAGPRRPNAAGWHLVRVGGELLATERSLDEAGVVDGEVLVLSPAFAQPDGRRADVTDVRAAVSERLEAAIPPRPVVAAHATAVASLAPAVVALTSGGDGGAYASAGLAVAMLAVAGVLARARGDAVGASIWVVAALAPAAVAAAVLGPSAVDAPWWAWAAAGIGVAAAGGAVVVPARAGLLAPLAAIASTVAATATALVPARRPGGVDEAAIAAGLVVVGLAVVELAPLLGFHQLGPVRTGRVGTSPDELDTRLRRSRRALVGTHAAGATAVVGGSVTLAQADAASGWWLVGLVATALALHARHHDHPAEMAPLIAGALAVAGALVVAVVVPAHGWAVAAGAAVLVGAVLTASVARSSRLRPVARRRLSRLEFAVAVPTVVAAGMSSGLFGALYRAGQQLG